MEKNNTNSQTIPVTENEALILLVGPSGTGKTSISEYLRFHFGLKYTKSYTDRPKRSEDEDGYNFVSKSEFSALEDICDETVFSGHHYGVTSRMLDESHVHICDMQGVVNIRKNYSTRRKIITVFLCALPNTLVERMKLRGDSEETALQRYSHDMEEFSGINYREKIGTADLFLWTDYNSVQYLAEQIIDYIPYIDFIPEIESGNKKIWTEDEMNLLLQKYGFLSYKESTEDKNKTSKFSLLFSDLVGVSDSELFHTKRDTLVFSKKYHEGYEIFHYLSTPSSNVNIVIGYNPLSDQKYASWFYNNKTDSYELGHYASDAFIVFYNARKRTRINRD